MLFRSGVLSVWLALLGVQVSAAEQLAVGSKRFTESYILAEIVARVAAPHATVIHRQGLGNTAIVFEALKTGAIDIYPEYTGTLAFELLGLKAVPSLQTLNALLAPHGVQAGVPLGFGNAYALAMSATRAKALGISSLSDLAGHANLRYGLTQEFLNRKDGWPGLQAADRKSTRLNSSHSSVSRMPSSA